MAIISTRRYSKINLSGVRLGKLPLRVATLTDEKTLQRISALLKSAHEATDKLTFNYNVSEAVRLLKSTYKKQ